MQLEINLSILPHPHEFGLRSTTVNGTFMHQTQGEKNQTPLALDTAAAASCSPCRQLYHVLCAYTGQGALKRLLYLLVLANVANK
jgi:hypothetical protein